MNKVDMNKRECLWLTDSIFSNFGGKQCPLFKLFLHPGGVLYVAIVTR